MNYERTILRLLERVSILEDEVTALKQELHKTTEINQEYVVIDKLETNDECSEKTVVRDFTQYIFEGQKYGKNRLVLAIVKKYVEMNPEISAENLMQIFKKELQGSLGVCRIFSEVQRRYKEKEWKIRFFTDWDEIIHTSTEDVVVCTQWGTKNIGNILAFAKQLGMQIEERRNE